MKAKIAREDILNAAAEIVKNGGMRALNARAVAHRLGCSTQPVYSCFANMDDLKSALYAEGRARYRRFIESYFTYADSRYESFGMGFVRFAREEKGFFRMLFLEEAPVADPFLADILAEMQTIYVMTEETARAFHADMAVFSFGLAALVNAGADYSDEEVREAFRREFFALYALYFPGRPRFWEEEQDEQH